MPQKRVPRYIPGYGDSYAMLSKEPDSDTAVIFVHGFGGDPTTTWANFHGLVDEYTPKYKWWAKFDMFFYAYDSVGTSIRRNAQLLGQFVEKVWHGERLDVDSLKRKYKDLIFAGHSEGGVVIRRMILDRYDEIRASAKSTKSQGSAEASETEIEKRLAQDFLLSSHLRLFSPACLGTNFSGWVGFLTKFSRFVSAITSSLLARNELLPGSPVLQALKAGTEQAHAEFGHIRALYTNPMFGDPDQIVVSETYQGEKILWDTGYDHFKVCKPNDIHQRPLEFVNK